MREEMRERLERIITQRKFQAALVGAAVALYLALALGSAMTKTPEIDEGFFANPALNLATKGRMGTTILETEGSALKGIREHTYWVLPLHLVLQAGWYKLFGFSLLSLRAISIVWGLVALAAWFLIMKRLTGARAAGLLAAGLLAVNYTFIAVGSLGRMDMMCAALGFAGLAAYLVLRERNLGAAVVASHALVVLSGLTHPNGIIHLAGLVVVTLYFDRRRLRPAHVGLAALPYLAGAVGWGLYILEDPSAFVEQFAMNSRDGGRLAGFKAPWVGFANEFLQRYPHAFGLGANSAGHSGPIYLKSLLLVPYVVAVVWGFASRGVRRHASYRVLLMLVVVYFLILSLIDGQKETPYLIHIFPVYVGLLVLLLRRLWEARPGLRPLVVVCVAGFLALEAGGMLLRIRQRTYQNLYQPTIAFLEQNSDRETQITGSSALGFGLNFRDTLKDDIRLGYASGKRPRFIVINSEYEMSYARALDKQPEVKRHISALLTEEYAPVYQNEGFKVYELRKK
ncbi:MAG: glycosyltransferase family 39 protein [Acidobacteriota bacterium]|nr:glycosyltransferase family 39 protein [Acidobacteriota bacterium]